MVRISRMEMLRVLRVLFMKIVNTLHVFVKIALFCGVVRRSKEAYTLALTFHTHPGQSGPHTPTTPTSNPYALR